MASSESKFITRGGLRPNQDKLPFTITTSDVESYLQKKIDVAMKEIGGARNNATDGDIFKENENASRVDINVYSTEAGNKFIPFVVVLPTSAEVSANKCFNNMADIFCTKETDGTVQLKNYIYEVIKCYTYNKADADGFRSDNVRRTLGIPNNTARVLLSIRTPKKISYDNGKTKVIEILIDPIRVFYDMVYMPNDTRPYKVNIANMQKIQTGEYRYTVERCINKGKHKNYSRTMAEELNRKMRGFK